MVYQLFGRLAFVIKNDYKDMRWIRRYRILILGQDIRCCFCLLVFLAVSLSACREDPMADTDQIKIGVFQSLTGPEATFGQDALHGIQLAAEEMNASGGILGRKVQLIIRDNQSKPGESSTITRELITREKVSALLGEVASGRSLEAAPIAQANRIPMIAASTNPRVTKMGNFIFRVCFTDDFQGRVIAKFVYSQGFRRVAIVSDRSQDYSIGLANSFSKYFAAQGGQIVKWQDYHKGDRDFNAQLTAIKSENPEVIFLPGYYTEVPLIVKQARQLGLKTPFVGGDGWDSEELFKLGGADMEGAYFANHFSPENQEPRIQNFVKNFQRIYGVLPPSTAAGGYDSMRLLADAIQRAKTVEPDKIRQALENTKNFPGVTGIITFDKNRNPNTSAVIIQLRNKKFTYFTTVNP